MSLDLCPFVGDNAAAIKCDGKRRTPSTLFVGSAPAAKANYADEATYTAWLKTAAKKNNGATGKIFAFPKVLNVTPITEADTTGKLALGPNRRLRKGVPAYQYMVEIGQAQFEALLAWDGQTVPVRTLDVIGQMWHFRDPATEIVDGEEAYLTISGNGFEDGNSAETGVCVIGIYYLDVDNFEKRTAYFGFNNLVLSDIKALKNVVMVEPSVHSTNVYKIQHFIKTAKLGANLNVYDEYGAILAGLTHTAFTGATFGTSLVITSIAVDAAIKGQTVTFDSTAFTALPAATQILFVPPTVAALDTAGITGIEIKSVILVK